jgi:hypothetical protein
VQVYNLADRGFVTLTIYMERNLCAREFVTYNFWDNKYWIPFLNFFLSLCEFGLTINYINGIANMYKKMSLIYGGGKEDDAKK